MMVTFPENKMELIPVGQQGNKKNELFYNYSTQVCRTEYIAPIIKKNNAQKNTFQNAMKLTILIGQFFGLNPVQGIYEVDSSKVRFSWYSWRCCYSIVSILSQAFFVCMFVVKLCNEYYVNLEMSSGLIFYGTNFATTILFLDVARKWPRLCQHISKLESIDPLTSTSIERKCNISCILILCLALLEHLLAVISSLAVAMACQPNTELFAAYVMQSYPWICTFFGYNYAIILIAQVANVQCTFNWSFANVFVICLSWYLEARLQQINDRIEAARGKLVQSSFWRTMREDYCKASDLVRRVDEVISVIILISFANNLFAICWQLFHLLEEGLTIVPVCGVIPEERPMMHGFEQVVYFAYSFVFLMARSLAVSIIPARLHSVSKYTAVGLYNVPSTAYCLEVKRFLDQVHGDSVALTGMQFFSIKRGLVLVITGTIITYELVLMQFTGVPPTKAPNILNITTPTPL